MTNARARLSVLYFLQFAVWGCCLTCLGQLLGRGGLGADIAWFYAAVGFVSLLFPALLGHVADRFLAPARVLGLCHLAAAVAMAAAWLYAARNPQMRFAPFFTLWLLFLCCYMPTLALANTTTFALLARQGLRPVDTFPSIRVWGTVGFVAAMWLVNCAYWHDGSFGLTLNDMHPLAQYRFQYTPGMLLCSAVIGLLTFLYTLTLPSTPLARMRGHSWPDVTGLRAFTLFKKGYLRQFLLLAVLAGVCLQITNGFATPFISHFMADPQYGGSGAAGNATMLFSLSQVSEAVCVLLVPLAMNRLGIKWCMVLAMTAWALRYLLFAFGNPGYGLWMLILSMAVYGAAFNLFTVAGHLYMEQNTGEHNRGFGQGLMMLMSNGFGASAGTLVAGAVVNRYCQWQTVTLPSGRTQPFFLGDWTSPWLIFAAYSLLLALLYLFLFHPRKANLR